jgi:hypothetical protein
MSKQTKTDVLKQLLESQEKLTKAVDMFIIIVRGGRDDVPLTLNAVKLLDVKPAPDEMGKLNLSCRYEIAEGPNKGKKFTASAIAIGDTSAFDSLEEAEVELARRRKKFEEEKHENH